MIGYLGLLVFWRWIKVRVWCHSLAVFRQGLRPTRHIWCTRGTCSWNTTRWRFIFLLLSSVSFTCPVWCSCVYFSYTTTIPQDMHGTDAAIL